MLIDTGCKVLDAQLIEFFPSDDCKNINVAVLGHPDPMKLSECQGCGIVAIVGITESFPAASMTGHSDPVILVYDEEDREQLELNCIREILYIMRQQAHGNHEGGFFNYLVPYYQEIRYCQQPELVHSLEALARFKIGSGKVVMPDDIFGWVSPIEHAKIFAALCSQCIMPAETRIAFNLDCAAIIDDEAYEIVCSEITRTTLSATLELNETAYHVNCDEPEKLLNRLDELTRLGVTLALDDFGKSNSNYDRLHHVGGFFSQIKIDKELFYQLTSGESHICASNKIHSLIAGFPRHFSGIVVEGVERTFHASVLTLLQARLDTPILMQGFYYSAPAPEHANAGVPQVVGAKQ